MKKYIIIAVLCASFFTQASYAVPAYDNFSNKQCDAIADACKNAGFTDEGTGDQSFWFGCMKPLLYGKSVKGVTMDKKDIHECRKAKIAKMKQELHELEAVK